MFEETSRGSDGLIQLFEQGTAEIHLGGAGALSENAGGPRKFLLPRGSAETRFAPRQYYYLASKSGVVPSWAVRGPDRAPSHESLAA